MTNEPFDLQVRNLTKSFMGVHALDDVSFTVRHGSILGLIGPNGSGKSTAIDCMTGFTKADRGSVKLGGHELIGLKPEGIARRGLTRTFQQIRLYRELTLLEHLDLASRGQDRQKRSAAADSSDALELLETLRIRRYANAPAAVLSYGQSKLLSLAMNLIAKPAVALLDEPLAGVNPAISDLIGDLIVQFNSEGQTFVIVEHNVPFIARMCQEVVVLNNGSVLAAGPTALIHEDRRVLEAFLGQGVK